MMNTSSKAWANAHKQAALNQKKRQEDQAEQKSLRIAEQKKEARIQAERNKAKKEKNMKSHLLPGWDWNWLVTSVCGFCFGVFLIWGGDGMQEDMNRAIDEDDDGRFPLVVWGETVFTNQAQFNKSFEMHGRVFIFGLGIALPSLLGVLVFGSVFCRRYFSAEARYRRIVDKEEWLAADRRRRQEGGQDN